jgi:hypothetical protein
MFLLGGLYCDPILGFIVCQYIFIVIRYANTSGCDSKRNNVEAVFHSLKAKFGSTLKSRNPEAQKERSTLQGNLSQRCLPCSRNE